MNLRTPCPPPVVATDIPPALPESAQPTPWVGTGILGCPVLVVEDDPEARKFIRTTLKKAGFKVKEACSGVEALELFASHSPRVVLLDLGLPDLDGFDVCQKMRALREDVAIIIITGRSEDADKVLGLELGADDYLVKPFGPEVLVARINAVMRRCARQTLDSDVLTIGDIRLEVHTMKVFKGEREVDLTPREFALLAAILRHPGEVLTRERLCNEVWGANHFGSMKALDVFICKLREKLEDDPAHPTHFKTQWGVGFVCL